ncbi:hypothetical protein ACFX57_21750, partial [Aeromonas allosaccharophila]
TLACGTGACAAVVIGISQGKLKEWVTVSLPGGKLTIAWKGPGQPVYMTCLLYTSPSPRDHTVYLVRRLLFEERGGG